MTIYIYIHSFLLRRREEGEILHPFARVNTDPRRRLDLDVAQRMIGRGGEQDALCGYEYFFLVGIFLREKKISTIFPTLYFFPSNKKAFDE